MIWGTGTKEKIRCQVRIKHKSRKMISLRAKCASTSGKAEKKITLRSVAGNKYTGSFHHMEFDSTGDLVNTRGEVVLTVRGSRLRLRMVSSEGTATVTLRR